jgi:hypothetical protein
MRPIGVGRDQPVPVPSWWGAEHELMEGSARVPVVANGRLGAPLGANYGIGGGRTARPGHAASAGGSGADRA